MTLSLSIDGIESALLPSHEKMDPSGSREPVRLDATDSGLADVDAESGRAGGAIIARCVLPNLHVLAASAQH